MLCCAAVDGMAQETDDVKVWDVEMEGNTTFSDLILKRIIAAEAPSVLRKLWFFNHDKFTLDQTELRRDAIRIQRFYQRRGFPDARVEFDVQDLRKEWKKRVVFRVDEQQPVIVDSVRIIPQGGAPRDSTYLMTNPAFLSTIRKSAFRKGKRFEPVKQPEAEGDLALSMRNIGFPYAYSEIQSSIDSVSYTATVNWLIYPGPLARFDSIFIEGEEKLDERFIRQETGISKGDPFSEKKLREAQREVFNHHMLGLALVSLPDQPVDSTLDVQIRVRELPTRSFGLRLGAGNFDRIRDNEFYKTPRGQLSWTFRNGRDRGERFNTTLNLSFYEQRFGVNYLFPYLFNTKSSGVVSPFAQHVLEDNFELYRAGVNNSFLYQSSQTLTSTLAYEFTVNDERLIGRSAVLSIDDILPDSVLSYSASTVTFSSYYTSDLGRGGSGWIIQPFLELSSLLNEASFSYQKISLDVRKYQEVSNTLTVAGRVFGGTIYFARQDSLPQNVLFYAGGTSSVRGWLRNQLGPQRLVEIETGSGAIVQRYVPLGGRAFFTFNTEFRKQLNGLIKGFGIAGFLDGGQVWRSMSRISERPVQFGVGGGIRYQSPIGPIRFDLGYKVNPTDEDLGIIPGQDDDPGRFARWGLHISIGQAF
ncbi:MAG: BamA/TamA family outer membrane protein [Bacteroidota bacterium]